MTNQNEATIPTCPWRVKVWCLRTKIDQMRDWADKTLLGGVGGQTKPPTLPAALRHFLKTGPGAKESRCQAPRGRTCPHGTGQPLYNRSLRDLLVNGLRLHHFRGQACNEDAILRKFQDQGWPCSIVDALGKSLSPKYGAWLKETVCRLNQCQGLIRFRSCSRDRAVSWEWRLP